MSEPDAPPARRPPWGVIVVVAVLVGIVWVVAAGISGALAYRDLDAARDAVRASESSLRDLELAEAREELATGDERASAASRRLRHPHVLPLRFLPYVGPNLRAVTTLSDAVRDTSSAAEELLRIAVAITGDGDVPEGGQDVAARDDGADGGSDGPDPAADGGAGLPVGDVVRLAPAMRRLADTLERTTAEVEASGPESLVGPVAEARANYLEVVGPRIDQVALAADATEVIPDFLGVDRPRRYLVGAASLSELRAAGGLFGSWTVLTADDGQLRFGDFQGVDDLGEPETDVTAPSDDFADRYADRGSLRFWRNANFTPHFPSAAQVWLALWEADGRAPLDGVIMVDAVTYEQIVQRSGPIEVAGVTTLEPGETVEFVGLEAYAAFEDDDERKQVLGAVATSAFARVVEALAEGDVAAMTGMLRDLTDGGHLMVYARDEAVQDVVVRAGLSGALPATTGEFAGVFVSNIAANKVDYFTDRSIEHRVRLLPGGAVRAAVDVEFSNDAPTDGYPRHVLGPWRDRLEVGDNASTITFVCGLTCELGPLPDEVEVAGTEQGHPVADLRLRVPAGQQRRVEYRTTTTDAWTVEDGDIVLSIAHAVQPTLHDTSLRVVLEVPDGFEPVELPEKAEFVDGEGIVWEEETSGDVRLTYRLTSKERDMTGETE